MKKVALSIAGSDPSGGAGIQADIKTFAALGVYGTAVPAALTAQSTRGAESVKEVSPAFLRKQLEVLLSDVYINAAKTGMLLSEQTVVAVSEALRDYRIKNLVVDPVMVSSTGKKLLRVSALKALVEELLPLALLVTPNVGEAEVLSGVEINSRADIEEAGRRILAFGPGCVLIKGGHMKGEPTDYLFIGKEIFEYRGKRTAGKELHGTGCVYSAAITACLAKGMELKEAVAEAKKFVTRAIAKAEPVGRGRLPLL